MASSVLAGLEPAAVFRWFEALCAIPHGSTKTAAISDFCAAFARERGLKCRQDQANNVVIWKDASPGYEDHPTVILQGHLDMVCEKEPDCDLDLRTDGLRLAVDGDRIYAKGTTLGGDDGIAIACALAVLDDDTLPHPPLEALFTTDEELGMLGAADLDPTGILGRRLLNMDSEEEGVLTVSCAGGATCTMAMPVLTAPASGRLYRLEIDGLAGGHSGMEIHKGLANANKLLGEALRLLAGISDLRLASVCGGAKDNAIPRSAWALFVAPAEDEAAMQAALEIYGSQLRAAYPLETELTITCRPDNTGVAKVWDSQTTAKALRLLTEVPNGVQTMSRDIEGLVETSLNLGILKVTGGTMELTFSVRSSVDRDRDYLSSVLRTTAERYGAVYFEKGVYPAWEYQKDSQLRRVMVEIFREQYGREPKVEAIHAGLECGLLAGKLPGLDCVSFGPDLHAVHTTRESMSIASVARTWKYLCTALERL